LADFYDLLEVPRNASADELKKAYRRRARDLHPDANPDNPHAEDQFKELNRAYEVLSDPSSRQRYDQFGEAGVGSSAASGGGSGDFSGGFSDIFDAFFGGGSAFGGGGRTGGGPAGPPRGQDIEVVAEIDFEAAVFGTAHPINLRTATACGDCNGSGAGQGTKPVTCVECAGQGSVRRVRQSILGQMVTAAPCTRCGGMGQVIVTPCAKCRGEGRSVENVTLTIDVPAGVDTGSTLRLSGRGAAGPRGGGKGDLYVHLKVRSHDRFVREGDDLVARVAISFAQATLGTDVKFDTLDGTENLSVPAGTQHGREFRLRGRGVPHVQGKGRGDLRAVVAVEIPTKLSKSQEELLRKFAADAGEDVSPSDDSLLGRIKSAVKK
jgi:molecular chaperone DnaJ